MSRSLAVLSGLVICGLVVVALMPPAPIGGASASPPTVWRIAPAAGPGTVYPVSFNESGLPSGTSWSVVLNGTTHTSTTTSIQFSEPNGSYNYTVSNVPGWRANGYAGSVTVTGAAAGVSVSWSQAAYSVTFAETGLPTATSWSVTLAGFLVSTTGSTLSFAEPNGTYNYSVANVPGWRASTYSGAVTVSGSAVTVTIDWTQTTYSVKFVESGLPNGTTWSVTLSGVLGTSTTNGIVFAVPNGTYSFNVSSVLGWRAAPKSGSVTVNGASILVNVSWTRVTYSVTFTETGLPVGTNWSVTLGGVLQASTTSTITFAKSNGSFAYSVGAISGYSIAPSQATLTVTGTAIASTIAFAAVSGATYAVAFTESGLSAGTPWGVTLGGTAATSTGTSITYLEANGALTYSIANVPGWRASTYSGSVVVSGASVAVSVSWVRLAYAVTFGESGLPSGTSWGISLNGVLLSSTSVSITFAEPNGSYSYGVANVAGWRANSYSGSVTVSGGPASVGVSWTQFAFPVTAVESGLPSGTTWGVTVNGTSVTAANRSIAFAEPNGTFAFSVAPIPGWRSSPTSGTVTVNGRSVTLTVSWLAVVYSVTFSETGLPTGTSWSVMLAGTSEASTNASIGFSESNGTYNFTVAGVPGYRCTPCTGSVRVNGTIALVSLVWSRAMFTVTFAESGLPSGTSWTVTLAGVPGTSTTSTISFPEPNGTYSYQITNLSGWKPAAYGGSVTVSGASVSITIAWTEVTYLITFTSTGLPSGTSWRVTFNGSATTSTSTSIAFSEPNGTFAYTVASGGWRASPSNGAVTVSGGPASLSVTWTAVTYSVSFNESGLPNATAWGVTLNGTLRTASSPSIAFAEPNGTYNYTVSPVSGYTPALRSGSVTVAGKSTTVSVSWSETTYPVTFTEFGLNAGTTWSVTLSGAVRSSNGATITFAEPNGTYGYVVAGLAGWQANSYSGSVTVSGKSASVTVSWNENTYVLSFVESGLPSGTSWSVSVGGTLLTSTGSLNSVGVPNGTYAYRLIGLAGWRANGYSGSITVSGQPMSVLFTFTQSTYPLTFTESGLPTGTTWSVSVSGSTLSTSGASISFTEPNGSFPYVVTTISGYTPGAAAGAASVAGGPAGVTILWTQVTYSVTFTESGLPPNASWAVVAAGMQLESTNRSIHFVEPNGTFDYLITGIPGFRTATYSGSVTVDGTSIVIVVSWTVSTYTVSFTATGLPSGTSWSVTLGGVVQRTTSDAVTFDEPNGSFAYSITGLSGWQTAASSGELTVSDGPTGVTVAWTEVTYPITFTETGLPAGTSWTVTIGGTAVSSTGTSISIDEPNGSYTYSVSTVRGYTLPASSGSVTVTVGPVTQPVGFRASPAAASFLGVSGTAGIAWLATAFAAIAAALALLVLLLRARRGAEAAATGRAGEPESLSPGEAAVSATESPDERAGGDAVEPAAEPVDAGPTEPSDAPTLAEEPDAAPVEESDEPYDPPSDMGEP